MDNKLSAYIGSEPYVFISYAHKDSEIVLPLVQAMQKEGYRVWYDLGIEVGTEWSNDIASHLRDCALFVAFTSKHSVKSENCLDEIAYAKSNQKPSLMVFLEEGVTLPEGTEMQTARFQRMYYNRIGSVEGFMESANKSTFFLPCRENVEKTEAEAAPAPAPVPEPVAQPTAPVSEVQPTQPKKKNNKLLIALIAVVAAIAIVCVLLFSGVFSSANPFCGEFTMGGIEYQLPMTVDELLKNGWTITDDSNKTLEGMKDSQITEDNSCELSLTKDGKIIVLTCYNNTAETCAISDAKVGGIIFTGDAYLGYMPDVEFAGGITLSSTKDEIIAAYGTPTFNVDEGLIYGDNYTVLTSNVITQDVNLIMFQFDEESVLVGVALMNIHI